MHEIMDSEGRLALIDKGRLQLFLYHHLKSCKNIYTDQNHFYLEYIGDVTTSSSAKVNHPTA
jgi:hypothetical protein